jgi:hypothetical protein
MADSNMFIALADVWDQKLAYRVKARKQELLITSDKGEPYVPATLANCKHNHEMLAGYTQIMCETGKMCTSHIESIKAPLLKFYTMQGTLRDDAKLSIHAQAWAIKRMLGVMKRKWSREECPRDLCLQI